MHLPGGWVVRCRGTSRGWRQLRLVLLGDRRNLGRRSRHWGVALDNQVYKLGMSENVEDVRVMERCFES